MTSSKKKNSPAKKKEIILFYISLHQDLWGKSSGIIFEIHQGNYNRHIYGNNENGSLNLNTKIIIFQREMRLSWKI